MEAARSPYIKHLFVCVNRRDLGVTCCSHGGGEAIKEKLKAYVKANGLKGKVRVSSSGCMDLCAQGPNVMVEPDHRWYRAVTLEDVDQIIEQELAPMVLKSEIASSSRPIQGGTPRNDGGFPPIRAFLFDLGNVLIRFDHMQAARKIADGTGASAEDLFKLLFESPLVADHDEGRISTPEFYEGLRSWIGLNVPYGQFLEVWNNIFSEDPQMMGLLSRLLARYPCYLISNTNRPHFEYCRQNYPILNQMTGWILSYEAGHLKPHPAIYKRALEMARLPASQIFYIDDRPDLIEAAQRLGFQTHPFTGMDPLLQELKARGIDG